MPKTDDDAPKCATCRFVKLVEEDVEGGVCRRYPPVLIPDGEDLDSIFPIVDFTDWCGEYQRQGCH